MDVSCLPRHLSCWMFSLMEVLALFCIFSCSVEPLMQKKKKKKYICKCTSFLQSAQTLKHYHFNITFDLYVFKKIGYNLLL